MSGERDESLSEKLARLVREYRAGDPDAQEAWNLIADFAECKCDAICAALDRTRTRTPTPTPDASNRKEVRVPADLLHEIKEEMESHPDWHDPDARTFAIYHQIDTLLRPESIGMLSDPLPSPDTSGGAGGWDEAIEAAAKALAGVTELSSQYGGMIVKTTAQEAIRALPRPAPDAGLREALEEHITRNDIMRSALLDWYEKTGGAPPFPAALASENEDGG